MATKNSRLLVIDTSIVRSCGAENATYPTSINCREFLLAVLKICHRAVLTPDLQDEWDRHQSSFARKWRVSMRQKRKIIYVSDDKLDRLVREKLPKLGLSENDFEAIEKDCHLIEAALATDKVVASLDETVRILFTLACGKIGALRTIIWVNPDNDDEQVLQWLEDGAQSDKVRLLGYTE